MLVGGKVSAAAAPVRRAQGPSLFHPQQSLESSISSSWTFSVSPHIPLGSGEVSEKLKKDCA